MYAASAFGNLPLRGEHRDSRSGKDIKGRKSSPAENTALAAFCLYFRKYAPVRTLRPLLPTATSGRIPQRGRFGALSFLPFPALPCHPPLCPAPFSPPVPPAVPALPPRRPSLPPAQASLAFPCAAPLVPLHKKESTPAEKKVKTLRILPISNHIVAKI